MNGGGDDGDLAAGAFFGDLFEERAEDRAGGNDLGQNVRRDAEARKH